MQPVQRLDWQRRLHLTLLVWVLGIVGQVRSEIFADGWMARALKEACP